MILTDLAELSVGDQQCAESLETLQGLVRILLARLLGDGHIRGLHITGVDLLSLPDEVLQQLALVLGEKQQLSLFDDVAQILDQDLTLAGKLI
jgi:hypothetical protein